MPATLSQDHELITFPTTIHYCRSCGHYAPHELRPAGMVCVDCVGRSVLIELNRD